MNAIGLVFDCLHAGFLGPYGNTWVHTPALNRLASQAFTFDCALADSPQIDVACRSYWRTTHALAADGGGEEALLPARLRAGGLTPVLMTDDRLVAEHPLADAFDEVVVIECRGSPRVAEELEQTHFAWCFARLVEWLDEAPDGYFLWCHLGGLGAVWDAPLEYREAYREPGDPAPFPGAEPPERLLPADCDPDEVLGLVHAYAGQVSLLDACLGGLLSLLGDRTALLAVAGARGFPLGEHRRVGPCDLALYGELVHVPMFLRLPDGRGASARSHALVQPADLSATLLEALGIESVPSGYAASLLPVIRGEQEEVRDCAVVVGAGAERAIRTPAWYLRGTDPPELFVKPDDRWEANNVASRCGEIAEQLAIVLSQICQSPEAFHSTHSPQIPEVLLTGLE